MTDAAGQHMVPPQYFAVPSRLPPPRLRSRSAQGVMAWTAGPDRLQDPSSQDRDPTEQFYPSEGLTTLGYVCA